MKRDRSKQTYERVWHPNEAVLLLLLGRGVVDLATEAAPDFVELEGKLAEPRVADALKLRRLFGPVGQLAPEGGGGGGRRRRNVARANLLVQFKTLRLKVVIDESAQRVGIYVGVGRELTLKVGDHRVSWKSNRFVDEAF